jgi:predicted GIY-YIG superfamily endonuclease
VRLAYREECANATAARRREATLKKMGHAAKAKLCAGFAIIGSPPAGETGGVT